MTRALMALLLAMQILAFSASPATAEDPPPPKPVTRLADLKLDPATAADDAERELLTAAQKALSADLLTEHTAAALRPLGEHCRLAGRYQLALQIWKQVVLIDEATLAEMDDQFSSDLRDLAVAHQNLGEYAASVPLLRRTLAIREKVRGPDDASTAMALRDLATALDVTGQREGVEEMLKRSLAIFEKVYGPDDLRVATTVNNLAIYYRRNERQKDVEAMYKRVVDIRLKVSGEESVDYAAALYNLGTFYENNDRTAEGEALLRKSLDIRLKTQGQFHADIVSARRRLAWCLMRNGKHQEARQQLSEALRVAEKAWGRDSSAMANTLNSCGDLYNRMDFYDQALQCRTQAVEILKRFRGPAHIETARGQLRLARQLADMRRADAAAEVATAAAAIINARKKQDALQVMCDEVVARVLLAQKKYEAAGKAFEQLLRNATACYGEESWEVADALQDQSEWAEQSGDVELAEKLRLQAVAICRKALPGIQLSHLLNNLALFYMRVGQPEKALPVNSEVLEINRKAFGESKSVADSLRHQGMCYRRLKRYQDGRQAYEEALLMYQSVAPLGHADFAMTLESYAYMLDEMGCHDEADIYWKRAREMRQTVKAQNEL